MVNEILIQGLGEYIREQYTNVPLPDMFHCKHLTSTFYQRSISKWAAEYILTEVQHYPFDIIARVEDIRNRFDEMSCRYEYKYLAAAYDAATDILDWIIERR